jgi:hypothetical protein
LNALDTPFFYTSNSVGNVKRLGTINYGRRGGVAIMVVFYLHQISLMVPWYPLLLYENIP